MNKITDHSLPHLRKILRDTENFAGEHSQSAGMIRAAIEIKKRLIAQRQKTRRGVRK